MSIFTTILNAMNRWFTASNLDAAQAFVAKYLPEFGDDLAAISKDLKSERDSLLELAEHAKDLWLAAKGTNLSTSLATALAQAAFNAAQKAVLAEARRLL